MKQIRLEREHKERIRIYYTDKNGVVRRKQMTAKNGREIRTLQLAMMLKGIEEVEDITDAQKAWNMLKNEPPCCIGVIVRFFGLFDDEDEKVIREVHSTVVEILEHVGARELFTTEEIL